MQVLFVVAAILAQGFAIPAGNIQISNLPVGIEISNLPSEVEISQQDEPIFANLPAGIEISHLPGEINLPQNEGIEISHLPAEIDLPSNGIEISHLPAEIDLPSSGIEISHLPAELPQSESTPNCVKYVRTLLEEVLLALPGGQQEVARPEVPAVIPTPIQENACTLCFQKLQLLIEKANSQKSNALTF